MGILLSQPVIELIEVRWVPVLADGGFVYAFQNSTWPGKLIIGLLFLVSVLAWTVMVTKLAQLKRAREQRIAFLQEFREGRQPLKLFGEGFRFHHAPIFRVYQSGCTELCLQMLGSTEVDETFAGRLELSPKITPTQMGMVRSAMERAVGEAALALEERLVLLSLAVSGAPFLGLLGTVWGVMETFGEIAVQGRADLKAMAPGVSAALITTVMGLMVAIPAMFGYNYLISAVKGTIVEMDNFAAQLAAVFDHQYVDHTPPTSLRPMNLVTQESEELL